MTDYQTRRHVCAQQLRDECTVARRGAAEMGTRAGDRLIKILNALNVDAIETVPVLDAHRDWLWDAARGRGDLYDRITRIRNTIEYADELRQTEADAAHNAATGGGWVKTRTRVNEYSSPQGIVATICPDCARDGITVTDGAGDLIDDFHYGPLDGYCLQCTRRNNPDRTPA